MTSTVQVYWREYVLYSAYRRENTFCVKISEVELCDGERTEGHRFVRYTRTYICTCINTCVHTYTHTYIYTYVQAYIHANIHAYMHTHIHTNVCTRIHTDVCFKYTYIIVVPHNVAEIDLMPRASS